jgi:hypothetical protein
MNDEPQIGLRIRQVLDRGNAEMSARVVDRLQEARLAALDRQRVAVTGLSFAGLGYLATESLTGRVRGVLAAMALCVGVAGTYYWNTLEEASAIAEIDSALLADEVPFSAYLDQGFIQWLDHVSHRETFEPSSPQ